MTSESSSSRKTCLLSHEFGVVTLVSLVSLVFLGKCLGKMLLFFLTQEKGSKKRKDLLRKLSLKVFFLFNL